MGCKIITIAQQKGGSGKTTLAAQLAVAFATRGRKVGLVDIDPQGSLTHWFGEREKATQTNPVTLAAVTGWRAQGVIDRLKSEYDILLVDSAPHAETEARIAVRAATLVLTPIQPSPMDLWAIEPTLALARAEKRPVLLVLNRVPSRVNLTDALAARIAELGVETAKAALGSRIAFAASMAEGKGVLETAPSGKAAQEIAALAAEITKRLARI